MQDNDYPWLYRASDVASRNAQRWYFRLLASQLTLFFSVSLLGLATNLVKEEHPEQKIIKTILLVLISILLGLAIITMLIGRERKFDKSWFDGRAVAESVKTATWRYMMKVRPFHDEADVERHFTSELDEIRRARSAISVSLATRGFDGTVISEFMLKMRDSDFLSRKSEYQKSRLGDQRNWYERKAKWNQIRATIWYWLVLALQILALALAIVAASFGSFRINVVGLMMTIAASFTAWSQAKRHDDLFNSYGMAAQELQSIESLIERATDEKVFCELVDQFESAISREHTMWCGKRSTTSISLRS
jgi:ABC-type multidrug transport system fused ATPase/permease subunit